MSSCLPAGSPLTSVQQRRSHLFTARRGGSAGTLHGLHVRQGGMVPYYLIRMQISVSYLVFSDTSLLTGALVYIVTVWQESGPSHPKQPLLAWVGTGPQGFLFCILWCLNGVQWLLLESFLALSLSYGQREQVLLLWWWCFCLFLSAPLGVSRFFLIVFVCLHLFYFVFVLASPVLNLGYMRQKENTRSLLDLQANIKCKKHKKLPPCQEIPESLASLPHLHHSYYFVCFIIKGPQILAVLRERNRKKHVYFSKSESLYTFTGL